MKGGRYEDFREISIRIRREIWTLVAPWPAPQARVGQLDLTQTSFLWLGGLGSEIGSGCVASSCAGRSNFRVFLLFEFLRIHSSSQAFRTRSLRLYSLWSFTLTLLTCPHDGLQRNLVNLLVP